MKGRVATLAAAIAVLALAGIAGAAPARHSATSVKVCYANAATDFSPAWVADKEGFFAKNGLDVSLVLAAGGKGASYLASGVCDINLDSGTPNITAIQKGADFVLVGGDANRFDFRLITKPNINGVKDLVDKKLALSSPGAAVDIAGRAMLKQFGLSASSVNIVYISSLAARLAALQSGSIDAMIISPPVAKVTAAGFKNAFNLQGLRFILVGIWTHRSFAQQNPDVIKAYLRSDVQAVAWIKNPANRAKMLTDLGQLTGFTDPADVAEAYADVLQFHQPEPTVDGKSLQNSTQWVNDQLGVNIDPNGFLYLGPLEQVLTRHLTASLTAQQQVPRPKGKAHGSAAFSGTLKPNGVLSWRLSYKGLTGKAVDAQIHEGKPGQAAPALLRLCAPCKAGASGKVKVYPGLRAAIKAGQAFVTISTPRNGKGEVRGQIAASLG